ncbi:MAG TPA: hypothetical protein VHQ97_11550 [Solirubrobacterales bacterium]|nr:hypothetical protein [Solirubrobacterales bacterium]
MRTARFIAALSAALALTSACAATAGAAPSDEFQRVGQLNTAAIPGFENPRNMVVNQQNGNILIYERSQIDQFDASGNPVNFSGLGSPSISFGTGNAIELLVDNGSGPTQGNIYALETSGGPWAGERIYSFTPDGEPIPGTPIEVFAKTAGMLTAGRVRPDGNLQIISTPFYSEQDIAAVLTPSGTLVGKTVPFTGNMPVCCGPPNEIFDEVGHLYGPGNEGEFWRFKPELNGSFTLEGNIGMPAEFVDGPLAIDPSNQDFLKRVSPEIRGVPYSDPLVKGTPYKLITGLEPVNEAYALDGTGEWLYVGEGGGIVRIYHRQPPSPPYALGSVAVEGIRTSRADVHAEISSNGADTTYYFEYGTDTNYGNVTPSGETPRSFNSAPVEGSLEGLQPDTIYHVRVVAVNSAGTTYGPDRLFKTYPLPHGGLDDPCPNSLARKQTSAQRLPDCRAYELVTARDTAGYDVESYLVPGQEPFPGFAAARDRVLYATHAGAVPGPWNATNKGRDPYLASRTDNGWVTDYKGMPADLNPASGSFASELGEADSTLDTFAFAGPNLCSPCFESGLETGIPVRLPSGRLVQGMAGSLDPGIDSARPEGKVAKYFSGDGRELVFASKYAFEPGANTGGSLTVYERNLSAGTTRIVSTDENGAVLTGTGISELDISGDGSRVVVGKNVSTDSEGNEYVHPYMHIGSSPNSVDLAPGSASGVLYAGMTADGSTVYYTTPDKLLPQDQDSSADLYRAAVDASGSLDLSLLTTNSAAPCNPVANSNGPHWNTTGAGANCDAVAIGGGGGVASSNGAVYFLSPEQLGGLGTADQPNLYEVAPGDAPQLVATLEPDNPLVLDSVKSAAVRRTGDFQVTPEGHYAVFTSALPLTGVGNFGFRSVYRYDAGAGTLACSSCDTTKTSDDTFADNASLAPSGLSVLENGSVFFTTLFPLVLNDANGRSDVYEASPTGRQELISSGTGAFDAGLLTVSDDGTDVFFFTHDTLAPEEDTNGLLMKIYDARVEGGFFKLPPSVPCKASDECHGPSSAVPPPPDIKSSGKSTVGNFLVCPKNRVKRRNQCVKRHVRHKKKHKKHRKARRAHAKKGGRHA